MDSREPEPPRKRRRISDEAEQDYKTNSRPKLIHNALSRPVSPPPLREQKDSQTPKLKQSPFQLTWIRDLPESSNANAVSLRDILGDPLISECWEFNYLHDLDFLMEAFDQDVRDMVKVHVVHGFWKNEDQSRLALKVLLNPYLYVNKSSILTCRIDSSFKVSKSHPSYCFYAGDVWHPPFEGIFLYSWDLHWLTERTDACSHTA